VLNRAEGPGKHSMLDNRVDADQVGAEARDNGAVRLAARPAGRGASGLSPRHKPRPTNKRAQRLLTDRRARARARLRARASDPNLGTLPRRCGSRHQGLTATTATARVARVRGDLQAGEG
jgi:hypothetical protein